MSETLKIVERNGSIVSFTGEFINFSVNNHPLSVDEAQLIDPYIGIPREGEKDATIIEENTDYVKCVTSSGLTFYRFIHRGTFWDKSDEENKRLNEIFRSKKEDFFFHGRVFMGLFIPRSFTDLALAIHLESVASCLRLGDDGIIYVVIYEGEHLEFNDFYIKFKSNQPQKKSGGGAKPPSGGAKPPKDGAKPPSGGAKPPSGGAKPSSGDSDTIHIVKGPSTSFVLKGRINDHSKNNDLVSSFLREDGTYLINTTSIPKGWKEGVKTPISVTIHTGIKIPICNVTRCDSTVPLETGDVLISVELSI